MKILSLRTILIFINRLQDPLSSIGHFVLSTYILLKDVIVKKKYHNN